MRLTASHAVTALVCTLAACASAPATVIEETRPASVAVVPAPVPVEETPARPVREFALPADWSTLPKPEFEARLAAWTREGAVLQAGDAALAELGRALAASDATSVRAAVILGNTRDQRAYDVLADRLEARVPEGSRSTAGDVVAAAACASTRPAPESLSRLEALATGPRPHPVFLVRVECALTSVSDGRITCIPFLLDVLREGTSTAVKQPNFPRLDWMDERVLRLQDRVARELSARAGIDCAYRARGPLAAREKEIARLAQLLQGAPAPK
jgi:hypothetical protein